MFYTDIRANLKLKIILSLSHDLLINGRHYIIKIVDDNQVTKEKLSRF